MLYDTIVNTYSCYIEDGYLIQLLQPSNQNTAFFVQMLYNNM